MISSSLTWLPFYQILFSPLSLRTFLLDAIDSIIPLKTRVNVVKSDPRRGYSWFDCKRGRAVLGCCSGRIACLWPAGSTVRALTTCCSKFHADSLSGMSKVQLDHRPLCSVEQLQVSCPRSPSTPARSSREFGAPTSRIQGGRATGPCSSRLLCCGTWTRSVNRNTNKQNLESSEWAEVTLIQRQHILLTSAFLFSPLSLLMPIHYYRKLKELRDYSG